MSRVIDLHQATNPYPFLTAGGWTVLPLMSSYGRMLKPCPESGFLLTCFRKMFFSDNARTANKSDLALDLSPNLTHITSQISKQHD